MIKYEREQLILEILKKSEIASIDEFVEASGASASTVRRDIDSLVKAGKVIALRGGAVKLNDRLSELPTTAKALINKDEKRAIAAEAAKHVSDGDTIYIDSGTTTLQLFPLLRGLNLQVVTSNTHLLTLMPDPGIRITILGGEYLPRISSVAGSMTERLLNDLFFDKAFIGASGCSAKAGISTFDVREAAKKRIVHENSNESYVLCDQTKFGKSTLYKALDIRDCNIITDEYNELLASAKSYIIAEAL